MSKIIGIDLGTTNSVVAVMQGGEPNGHPQPGSCSNDALLVVKDYHEIRRTPCGVSGQAARGLPTRKTLSPILIKRFPWGGATTK